MSLPFRYVPPPRSPWTFVRPRLLQVLACRWDFRLVAIEAGAGIGKTTLLAQALEENRLDPRGRDVWLSLEPADSSESKLAESLLRSLGRPVDARRPVTIVDVCDAIWDLTPLPVCLVLDDAHHLDPESGATVLTQLLDTLPENGHLVLAGRRLPSVPRARLLSQKRAISLGETDIRFSDDESVAFARMRNVAPTILDGTAGWPALAELRASFGAATDHEFLWEEVLAPLPPTDRRAFMLIAAVGGGDADLCAAAAGHTPDVAKLATLPLSVADGAGGLRPHALWGEVVRARLDPGELEDSRRRVAEALRARAEHGSAFELLAATQDWDSALPVLFEACNDQRHPPLPDVVARWRSLVHPSLADRPEVVYLDAYISRSSNPWSDDAWTAFTRAVEMFRARGDIKQAVVADVRMLWSAWLRGDPEEVRVIDRRIYPDLAGRPGEGLLTNLAILADMGGDTDTLRTLAGRLNTNLLEPRLRHFPGLHHVQADLVDGCASAVTAKHAAEAAEAGRLVEPAAASGWAILAPGVVAWACGRLDDALAFELSDIGPRFSIAEQSPAFAFGAIRAAHLGQLGEAETHLTSLRNLAPPGGVPDLLAGMLAVATATVAFARGDTPAAIVALQTGLAGRELGPSGAGKAIFWFPAVPYLLDARCRDMLEVRGSGASRQHILDLCRALRSWRLSKPEAVRKSPVSGRATTTDDFDLRLLDDARALLCAMPLTAALELAARAHQRGNPLGRVALEGLSGVVPSSVRDALQLLTASAEPNLAKEVESVSAGLVLPPPHNVRIEVFGPIRVFRGGVAVTSEGLGRERVRQLLCTLVAHREIRRNRLGTLMWPERDETTVSSNLRMTLSYLQAILEPDRLKGASPWYLRQERGMLRLGGDTHLTVDAWDVEDLLNRAELARADATPSVELGHLHEAFDLWRGEYLDDVSGDEWSDPIRGRFNSRMVRAMLRCGELLLGGARANEAIVVAERVLQCEPWCEAAYRLAIRSQIAVHDRSAALRHMAVCLRMCVEIGVEPESATRELERSLNNEGT